MMELITLGFVVAVWAWGYYRLCRIWRLLYPPKPKPRWLTGSEIEGWTTTTEGGWWAGYGRVDHRSELRGWTIPWPGRGDHVEIDVEEGGF